MSLQSPTSQFTDAELDRLQLSSLLYYLHETNPDNGLVRDKTDPTAPASVAAIGMSLAALPVIVERAVTLRAFAARIARRRLRMLYELRQGPESDATGYKGFFYHFLDMDTGRRVWQCELSTIDTALLLAGALAAATYFDREEEAEADIRRLARALYERVEWPWMLNGSAALSHGWRPESGFIPHRWQGYDEGLLLYILALGSQTHALPVESYDAYCATYQWKRFYDRELLYCGPLFTHQFSHLWIDFRDLRDRFMREHGSDYFRNSREATFVHQAYAMHNPMQWAGYGEHCWGFTACDGPGWLKRPCDGTERDFFDYNARGAPLGPDDGTVSPWIVVASLPFAPEIVVPTVRHFEAMDLGPTRRYGFRPSFNRTFLTQQAPGFWVSPHHFGIDQGPITIMVENVRSGLIWNLIRRCDPFVTGLRRAGFTGGWLE